MSFFSTHFVNLTHAVLLDQYFVLLACMGHGNASLREIFFFPVLKILFVPLFSIPYRRRGGSDGTVAKDAIGNDVLAAEWLKDHGPGDRTLTQGLKVLFAFLICLPTFAELLLFSL